MLRIKNLFALILIFANFALSQMSYQKERITYDIDKIPVLVNLNTSKQAVDSIFYIEPNGDLIRVSSDIRYWSGENQLKAFCDHLYYNRYGFNGQEMNDVVEYCVIFDEDLQIKDIRILKRFHDVNDLTRNYTLVYSILLKTEGHWILDDNSVRTWHVYRGHHKFY